MHRQDAAWFSSFPIDPRTQGLEKHRVSVAQLCPPLCDPVDCSQAPLSVEFSRQEYRSGLPFPSPGGYTEQMINKYWKKKILDGTKHIATATKENGRRTDVQGQQERSSVWIHVQMFYFLTHTCCKTNKPYVKSW